MDILTQIETEIKKNGFNHYGFISIKTPLSLNIYQQWIEQNLQGDMEYLKTHYETKKSPHNLMAQAHSALVIACDYLPHPQPTEVKLQLGLAKYAQGQDYHYWFKSQLQSICDELKKLYSEHDFMAFTDSHPLMERDLAYQAGLGWFGKNTCLLHKDKGSYFFIGEILTSLKLPVQAHLPKQAQSKTQLPTQPSAQLQVQPDMCGTCNRCIEACPTEALEPKKLDATKCISYLNIESKKLPPIKLRSKMGDWFFGCDICQQVCPWNEKVFGEALNSPKLDSLAVVKDLKWILESSNKSLLKKLRSTPLVRAGAKGLKRNAIIVATNLRLTELTPTINNYLDHPYLGELAQWAVNELQHNNG